MKKVNILLLSLAFVISIVSTAYGRPILSEKIPTKPILNSEAAICIDVDTGQVYFEKSPDKRMYPASTTKMMTAIIALEMGDLNSIATVSENAGYTDEGQNIRLSPGDSIRLGDLVQAALMHSANDSTVAIGEQVGGSEKVFIEMMNNKAKVIGAYKTNYANTNGYSDPNHYTTARDLSLIARYGINTNEKFRKLVNTKEAIIKWKSRTGTEKKFELYNTNRLLHTHDWIDGVKTGTTPLAGNCLVSYGNKNDRRILTVVLNSGDRYGDTMAMFNYAYKGFEKIDVISKGEIVGKLPVIDGVKSNVRLKSTGKFSITIPVGELSKLKRDIKYFKELKAPLKAGEMVGKLVVNYQGKVIYQTDLITDQAIEEKGFFIKLREKIL